MKAKSNSAALLWDVTLLVALIFAAPRAQAQGCVPLWTNRCNGPGDYWDVANAVEFDGSGNVFVTGALVANIIQRHDG